MNRKEAEGLIGEKVTAWTAMNGVYVGRLSAIAGKPWRAVVEITSIVQPAAIEFSRGDRQRRGFRPGEIIEVGGINIQATDRDVHPTYLEALVAAERSMRESVEKVAAETWRPGEQGKFERILALRAR